MTPRERVKATYAFKKTDRVAYDLSESRSWPEMDAYFKEKYNIDTHDDIIEFLDPDFRWADSRYCGPSDGEPGHWGFLGKLTYSAQSHKPPLKDAASVSDVLSYKLPDPSWWKLPDFAAVRKRWPDYALVFYPEWMPLFCCACYAFGMDTALSNMILEQDIFEAYIQMQNEFCLEMLSKALPHAKEYCDICWLGDDYASQTNMMFSPELFRKLIKPHLAKQVKLIRGANMDVLFHSCGSVRSILPDLIDIGVNAMSVFQTTAGGMDAQSISRNFGGKMVFYGGIDSQSLLTFGTAKQVEAEVKNNIKAFENCGGYIAANCHHGLADIRASNIEVMCKTARETPL